jgi:hypothetical protein
LNVTGNNSIKISYDGSILFYWDSNNLNTLYYILTSTLMSNFASGWSSYSLSSFSSYTSVLLNTYKRMIATNNDGNIVCLAATNARVIIIRNLRAGSGISSSIVNVESSNSNPTIAIACSKTANPIIISTGIKYYISYDIGVTWSAYTSIRKDTCDVVCSPNGVYMYVSSNSVKTLTSSGFNGEFGLNLLRIENKSTITSPLLNIDASFIVIGNYNQNNNVVINGNVNVDVSSNFNIAGNTTIRGQSLTNTQWSSNAAVTLNTPVPDILILYQSTNTTAITITFPTADSTYNGCKLIIRRSYSPGAGGTIVSASSNIIPITGNTPGTAILSATESYALLVCAPTTSATTYAWYIISEA